MIFIIIVRLSIGWICRRYWDFGEVNGFFGGIFWINKVDICGLYLVRIKICLIN